MSPRPRRSQAGFTLIELLVGVAVSLVAIAGTKTRKCAACGTTNTLDVAANGVPIKDAARLATERARPLHEDNGPGHVIKRRSARGGEA